MDELQETAHRCRVQERALERVNTDFQHLVSLVERAVLGVEARSGADLNFATLLQRLRNMSITSSKAPVQPAALERRFNISEEPTVEVMGVADESMLEPTMEVPRTNKEHTSELTLEV